MGSWYKWFSLLFFCFQFYWFLLLSLLLPPPLPIACFRFILHFCFEIFRWELKLLVRDLSSFLIQHYKFLSRHCFNYILQIIISCIFILIQISIVLKITLRCLLGSMDYIEVCCLGLSVLRFFCYLSVINF